MANLKIAMVNTEFTRGGAARMAASLTETLNSHDDTIDATLYHCEDAIDRGSIVGLKRMASRPLNAGLARIGGSYAILDLGVADELIKRTQDSDILHIHNLHGYYLNFEKLLRHWQERPVVWTWHDMWGATGRCGFSFDCERWKTGCRKCPDKSLYPKAWLDWAYLEFARKTDLFSRMKNLTIISPSDWLAGIAIERGFAPECVNVIPNPVNTDHFKALSKAEARADLGMPLDRFVVLFMASDCGDKRKGYDDFAIITSQQPWQAIAVGKPPEHPAAHIYHAGVIKEPETLNRYYAAADVMVIPTYADNYPNTVIESLVSGTPVIGYDEGGVASQLDFPGCELVGKGDKEAVSALLRNRSPKNDTQAQLLAEKARERWSLSSIAQAYSNIYRKI